MANKQKPKETKPTEVKEVKRVIKRRRRKKGKGKQYFTQETENAIVEYNGSDDAKIRNNIYNERIRYAFEKLAENILNTFQNMIFIDFYRKIHPQTRFVYKIYPKKHFVSKYIKEYTQKCDS